LSASAALARHGWTAGKGPPMTPRRVDEHTWQRLVREPGLVLFLHWRPLPQRCTRIVGSDADHDRAHLVVGRAAVATQSPTAHLLRLWAQPGEPHPGHQLRTLCDTADVLERCSHQIDWARLWSDCARLELLAYGEMYLSALPAVVGEPALRELRACYPA
jgi:hypothetical protein